MEEKKLLWVVLFISIFVLAVFGSALYLYSPSRSQSPSSFEELAYLKEINDAPPIEKIDPDMWSRQLDKVPEYEENRDEKKLNGERITVVDGNDVEDGKKYIDVAKIDSSKLKEDKKISSEVVKELGFDENTEKSKEERVIERIEKKDVKEKASKQKNENIKIKKPGEKVGAYTKESNKKIIIEKKNVPSSIEVLYWVQTASLSSRLKAENARDKLVSRHMKVEIFTKETSAGLTHRVRVGPFKNNTEAEYWLKNIKEIQGFESSYISQERIRV